MTRSELESLMDAHAPRWRTHAVIEALDPHGASITVRMPFHPEHLRAGATLSGPALMALADRAAYLLAIVHTRDPTVATASLDIHFLSRPPAVDAIATATVLRAGRRLLVAAIAIHAADRHVAHATVTYAVTPRTTP